MTLYDRTIARFSRRELMKIAWMLGAAAVAPSDAHASSAGDARSSTPIRSRLAWRLAIRCRMASCCGRVSRRKPLEGGGMPPVVVGVEWEVARDPRFTSIAQKGHRARAARARTQRARRSGGPRAGSRLLVPLSRRRRGQPDRPNAHRAARRGARRSDCALPCAAAATTRQGYFTAFRRIAEEQFDFVFHTGDYIYEGAPEPGRSDRIRYHVGQETYTLVDYRNRYALYKSDRDLLAAHASAPFVVSWDDHEVEQQLRGRLRRERHATRGLRAAAGGGLPGVLRSDAAARERVAVGQPHADSPAAAVRQSHRPERARHAAVAIGSGLRRRQPQQLRRSAGARSRRCWAPSRRNGCSPTWDRRPAEWTVIGQQVPTYVRDMAQIDPDGRFSMDKWDGYVAARKRLYDRLQETKAPNPIVLSGDVHMHFGADLKADFTNPAIGNDRRRVHELVDHVHRRRLRRVLAGWEQVKGDNPHIKLPQRPPRLHRVHRHPSVHARGLQDPRPSHHSRRARQGGRFPGRARLDAREASRTETVQIFRVQISD